MLSMLKPDSKIWPHRVGSSLEQKRKTRMSPHRGVEWIKGLTQVHLASQCWLFSRTGEEKLRGGVAQT